MNEYLFDAHLIRALKGEDKGRAPISIAAMPGGQTIVVSQYGDVVWDFWPYIPQENIAEKDKRIDWSFKLPDGRSFSDPEHANLLDSAKSFLWSLVADPIESRKRPTMTSVVHKFYLLRILLRWMVEQGIGRFEDLAGRTFDYVPTAKQKTLNVGEVSEGTTTERLAILEDIYHQREKLGDALRVHPWPGESASWLAGQKVGFSGQKPKTNIIPDDAASQLATVSLSLLADWNQGISPARRFTDRQMRTACHIIIGMFSGIRNSEMTSLATDCISHRLSLDQSTEITLLHGTIYKTGVCRKAWLVPPIVEDAVKVLTELGAGQRAKLEQEENDLKARLLFATVAEQSRIAKRLSVVSNEKNKLFLGFRPGQTKVLCGTAMTTDLKRFCGEMGVVGRDGRPYPLHAHQFRRTYAHFMARSQLGDLLTLRDHFGHAGIDMTTYYTDGAADEYESDIELFEMIAEEKHSRQAEIMESYLDSDAPLANGMHWLKDWRATVRTAENKETLISQYAGAITINGTGHSWCVGSVKGTGCGGLCVFEAQKCVDCNYGIIGQEHRPVWEGIRDQQIEALALDDMGVAGSMRAKEILGYAEKVLQKLDGLDAA